MSEDAPWLSPAQLSAWMHLTTVFMTVPNAVEQQLKRDEGLNLYEYSVLAGLSGSPGHAMKMSDLADIALGSPSRLSHAVTRLERVGWVRRRNCSRGTRTVEAVLTEAGYAKLAQAAPGHAREARRVVVDVLNDQELAQLQQLLRKLLQANTPQSVELLDKAFQRYLDGRTRQADESAREPAGEPAPEPAEPQTQGLLEACKEDLKARVTRTGRHQKSPEDAVSSSNGDG